MGRLEVETYEDGTTVRYAYDNSGNLATVTDSATGVVTTYYYDLLNRQSGYREQGTNYDHSVTYTYDAENNLSSVTEDMNGVTKTYSYTYDEYNKLISETVNGITVEYTYDGFGRLEKRIVKNGTTEIYSIEPSYSAGTTANSTSTQVTGYNGFTYTYDDNGNILSASDGTNTTNYQYDSQNQLIRENNQAQGYTHTWTYNNAGNIVERNEYAYTLSEELDIADAIDSVSYNYQDTYGWGDLLTSYDGRTITYDEIGNPLSDGEWTYTWKRGRQLASMTKGNTTWTYTYDASGMRTERSPGDAQGTYTYVYNGSQLSQMIYEGYAYSFTYDAAGTPLTFSEGNNVYYYETNLQGDVIGIEDSSGQQVVTYAYDAWGNVQILQGNQIAVINPLLYRGYVYDWETGLYYLQSRYYNPEWGRFINADNVELLGANGDFASLNLFAYCGNNPTAREDDGGEFWHIVIGAAVGAVIGAVATGITSYIEDGEVDWASVGISALAGAASGALTSVGVCPAVAIAGNAAISMAENATTQVIENKGFDNFNAGHMLIEGAIGAASGAVGLIGGSSPNNKHLTKLGCQTVKRTFNTTAHKGLKAGLKEAGKAFVYYGKNTSKYYKGFFKELYKDVISTAASSFAESEYMKFQYRRLMGM